MADSGRGLDEQMLRALARSAKEPVFLVAPGKQQPSHVLLSIADYERLIRLPLADVAPVAFADGRNEEEILNVSLSRGHHECQVPLIVSPYPEHHQAGQL